MVHMAVEQNVQKKLQPGLLAWLLGRKDFLGQSLVDVDFLCFDKTCLICHFPMLIWQTLEMIAPVPSMYGPGIFT